MRVINGDKTVNLYLPNDEYPNLNLASIKEKNFNVIRFFKNELDETGVALYLSNGQMQQLRKLLPRENAELDNKNIEVLE